LRRRGIVAPQGAEHAGRVSVAVAVAREKWKEMREPRHVRVSAEINVRGTVARPTG
jgi:hypothetical protein